MMEYGLKRDIENTVRKYLYDTINFKCYRWKNTNTVLKIFNILANECYVPLRTKEDISLSYFLFKVEIVTYDENPQFSSINIAYKSLPELYNNGWEECDRSFYADIHQKVYDQYKEVFEENKED